MDKELKRDTWMVDDKGIFIDIHDHLRSYQEVLSFLSIVERDFDIKRYCNGANGGGRWFYQFYSKEFIQDIASLVESLLKQIDCNGPILEVMAGDGLLSHYLKSQVTRPIIAADNKSSRDDIEFPKTMEQIEAIESLEKYEPCLIIICWEPYYSDASIEIIERLIPVIWIGNPTACAVSSAIHELDYVIHPSPFRLGRHDLFNTREFRTEIRIYNHP